jgi:hypothetical protein
VKRRKWFFGLLAIGLVLGVYARNKPPMKTPPQDENKNFVYQEVVDVPGITADELYSRAKAALALAYESAPDVTKLDDPQAKKLIVKGYFNISFSYTLTQVSYKIWHTLILEAKDGKYRVTLKDFRVANPGFDVPLEQYNYSATLRERTLDATAVAAEQTLANIKKEMETSNPAGGKSNW